MEKRTDSLARCSEYPIASSTWEGFGSRDIPGYILRSGAGAEFLAASVGEAA